MKQKVVLLHWPLSPSASNLPCMSHLVKL